ncbi:hypothetical protein DASC09_040340 [Saccharomycopsis crataegensis]|uniref:Uncharacterized protein n=1 Tax=Saccharomycopsis crataegensis TaxID=43959 RepID=A0AAV5QPU3_9ASCO|nr:hypothetical protein DASC09_040340 [Saccharomycopsis crataegensis]
MVQNPGVDMKITGTYENGVNFNQLVKDGVEPLHKISFVGDLFLHFLANLSYIDDPGMKAKFTSGIIKVDDG